MHPIYTDGLVSVPLAKEIPLLLNTGIRVADLANKDQSQESIKYLKPFQCFIRLPTPFSSKFIFPLAFIADVPVESLLVTLHIRTGFSACWALQTPSLPCQVGLLYSSWVASLHFHLCLASVLCWVLVRHSLWSHTGVLLWLPASLQIGVDRSGIWRRLSMKITQLYWALAFESCIPQDPAHQCPGQAEVCSLAWTRSLLFSFLLSLRTLRCPISWSLQQVNEKLIFQHYIFSVIAWSLAGYI